MAVAVIGEAVREDAAAVAALHARLFSPPWSTEEFGVLIADPGAVALVARDARAAGIVGFVLGRVAADEAEILSIGVAANHQRQGIARRLALALAARAAARGAAQLYLEVSAANTSAIALYRALGFETRGTRRGYYRLAGKPPEDAHLLALDLTANRRVD